MSVVLNGPFHTRDVMMRQSDKLAFLRVAFKTNKIEFLLFAEP
jgi:hypothetical protein